MRLLATFFVVALLLSIQGCGNRLSQPRPGAAEAPTPPPAPPVMPPPLTVTPTQIPIVVEWGTPAEITLALAWIDSRVQPVTLTVSGGTPRWLTAELPPDTLEPPTTVRLRLTALSGSAAPGLLTLVISAVSPGLDSTQRVELPILVRRVGGEFTAVASQAQSQSCSTICGCINPYLSARFLHSAAPA